MYKNWDKDQLIASMRPIADKLGRKNVDALSEMEQSFCQFYGIDKENQMDGVKHCMGSFKSSGFQLAMHYFKRLPDKSSEPVGYGDAKIRSLSPDFKGTAFVFHGYFDHTGLYGHIIEYLLRSGYDVIIYDLPGHGLSSGKSVAITDFGQYKLVLEECLAVCSNVVPDPWFAIGQSTGAAVLLEYLFNHRLKQNKVPFKHFVFLAPLLRPVGWNKLLWLQSLLGRFIKTWKREFVPNSHDTTFVRFLREEDPLQVNAISVEWAGALRHWVYSMETKLPLDTPVTIIQGPEDGTVDWRYNIPRLKQLLPLARIKILNKGRHQLVNESPEIRDKAFGLMTKALNSSLVENFCDKG